MLVLDVERLAKARTTSLKSEKREGIMHMEGKPMQAVANVADLLSSKYIYNIPHRSVLYKYSIKHWNPFSLFTVPQSRFWATWLKTGLGLVTTYMHDL